MADKMADHIEVFAKNNTEWSLRIDGQEFPWFISSDGVQTIVGSDNCPSVTVTIFANRVSVEHDWTPAVELEHQE